jgi:uncharacterized protein YkwD
MHASSVVRTAAASVGAVLALFVGAPATDAAVVPPVPPLPPAPVTLPPPLGSSPSPSAPAPSPSPQRVQSAPTAPAATVAQARVAAQLERLVAAEINVVRRRFGRPRLQLSTQLIRAGEAHARDLALAGYFSHSWSDGTPYTRWIKRYYPASGRRSWTAGENLGWSTTDVSAQRAVEMWLDSPQHRRVLLDRSWRQIGLGIVRADDAGRPFGGQSVVLLAAEFGTRR